jgi:hypothetical protein
MSWRTARQGMTEEKRAVEFLRLRQAGERTKGLTSLIRAVIPRIAALVLEKQWP